MTQASPGEASKVPEKTPQGVTEPADVAALVDGLLRPEAYPWRPTTVELVETHVSWVFLSGERVVKVKKPVDYGLSTTPRSQAGAGRAKMRSGSTAASRMGSTWAWCRLCATVAAATALR